jgi:hypothetical protein
MTPVVADTRLAMRLPAGIDAVALQARRSAPPRHVGAGCSAIAAWRRRRGARTRRHGRGDSRYPATRDSCAAIAVGIEKAKFKHLVPISFGGLMARQSAEARSAAAFRAGGTPRPAPPHLSKPAAELWAAITASKPADWFDAGSAVLLESYCELAVQGRALARHLARLRAADAWPEAAGVERRFAALSARLTTLASKLRLSVQSVVAVQARKLAERGTPAARRRNGLLGLN